MARFSNRPDQWRAAGAAVPSRRLFLQGRRPFSCRYRKNQARYIRYEIQGSLLEGGLKNWASVANQHKPIRESSLAERWRPHSAKELSRMGLCWFATDAQFFKPPSSKLP